MTITPSEVRSSGMIEFDAGRICQGTHAHEGVLRCSDTHDELVNMEHGLYAEMFAAQSQYYVS